MRRLDELRKEESLIVRLGKWGNGGMFFLPGEHKVRPFLIPIPPTRKKEVCNGIQNCGFAW